MFKDRDPDAKDREFFMQRLEVENQRRIRESKKREKEHQQGGIELRQKIARNNQGKTEETITINDKDRTLLEGNIHNLRFKENNNSQSPQVKNLRSTPTNEHIKGTTIVELRPKVLAVNNQEHNIKPDPYFDHYSKVENKGLLEQTLQTALEGVKHQVNRQIQKHQIKTQEQTQQKQQIEQPKQVRRR